MGYTVCRRPSWDDRKGRELFRQEFTWESETSRCEILLDALVSFTEYYAVAKRTNKETGEVIHFGIASRCHINKNEYGYRGDDESVGPVIANCPRNILTMLDKLAPLDDSNDYDGWARSWRQRCWNKLDARAGRTPNPHRYPEAEGARRQREAAERARDKWVTVTAWGDWKEGVPKGMVGIAAVIGGRTSGNDEVAYFLVPEDEYQNRPTGRDDIGFVIDETRHERTTEQFGTTKRIA